MDGFDGRETSAAAAPTDQATAPDGGRRPMRMRRRVVTVAVGLGAAAGVAVGATVAASAATSPTTTRPGGSGSTTTPGTYPGPHPGLGGRFHGDFIPGGPGGGGGVLDPGSGGIVHGQYTVNGPNGYETLDVRSGTVSDVSNKAGSTWSHTVKSADATSGTFTVNSSTSVNGGESGIASVKNGDTVDVTGTVSGATSTATRITDVTTLQANGKSWMPMRPSMPSGATAPGSGSESGSTTSAV
jgi:hypothetical protein